MIRSFITSEPKPSVHIIKKKRTHHNGANGIIDKPSGNTTNAKPGPKFNFFHTTSLTVDDFSDSILLYNLPPFATSATLTPILVAI